MLLTLEKKDKNINIITPKIYLLSLKNKKIFIKLKWGVDYKGILMSVDRYLNLHLLNTEEWKNNLKIGYLGEIFIRCNNIQFLTKIDEN
ncbi:small nuclear ribonucleoprotein E-like protein (nucleomorph) [Cryptomonas paramecium]|uniref:Sm protein F n=1 Tax=Cryptomonas paramaecium TaxID=2898 RepID=F2HHB3_9CRYP|nr:small nuclear ribonucleoprotein E-like protein [Cryptomonas paramecium]AEA38709.1 small nuclear ribonucleoprotein E-like protein [Cryptomonas paramecium]|mmetsp:Transcript_53479/g.141820  ORF Transcript_53479/g.141820 Transcript_53479/m.141820 type:complete len:89 (-) Transcript_53479:5780-6046(-)